MNRERPRYRVGDLRGEDAAAGASPAGVMPGRADHYDPNLRLIFLTLGSRQGRTIEAVLCAVHEAMHARQHAEMSASWRLYQAGKWAWLAWLCCMAMAAYSAWSAEWRLSGLWVLMALFCGVLKAFTILNLETDAWERTRKWVMENFITGADDWAVMDRVAKASVSTYAKGIFGI